MVQEMNVWRDRLRKLFPVRMRVYSRLMLYNTAIFVVVAFVFTYVAGRYSQQIDTIKQLQQSRDALNAIYNYYDTKQNDFVNLVLPLYEDPSAYQTLSEWLEAPSDDVYENDASAKSKLVQMMELVAVRDRDLAAILVRKERTGATFLYTRRNRLVERVDADDPFVGLLTGKAAGRSAYGTKTIRSGPQTQDVYGISGTLRSNGIRERAGTFLFAYAEEALDRVFQPYAGRAQGRFLLVTREGEIIFDTAERSSGGDGRGGRFPHMDLLEEGVESAKIDGEPYFVQTVKHDYRGYVAVNLIPKEDLLRNGTGIRWIYVLFASMAFVCAVLYLIAGRFVTRRVNELIRGMKRVGSNHWDYRIPERGRYDEFEEIASRFNLMVDELRSTINREYVSEIKKKNAELKALQAGISPHFLYNTLEAIRIKAADDGNDEVAEMIVLLAQLYRSIVRDRNFIEIRKELSLCRLYLNLFSIRYASRLEFDIDVDAEVLAYGIPKNLLQPIIENYFVHGIHLDRDDNAFSIRGYARDGDIVFEFENNGRGMTDARLQEIRRRLEEDDPRGTESYGLTNVNERIRLVYGRDYGLRLESGERGRTTVRARIKALTCEELEGNLRVRG